MSKTLRQLNPSQRNKTMKRLTNCSVRNKNMLKNCHTNKKTLALKKEILCLKRCNTNLTLQLQEQKLECTTLNRRVVHLDSEVHKLQLANSALKEENRYYEKLINTAEPDIRSCMTHLVETSQTLANLQMAINRNRSRQQLTKISGSLGKVQPKLHVPATAKSTGLKHCKNVNNVAPRRKQLVRPMVQGLSIFTNLTIPLQRISLPNQNTLSHIQVPVVETPQEPEEMNISVEPERSGPALYEKHRRNLHYVKNKSKPKTFAMKKEVESRHSKNYLKHKLHFCSNKNFESSESESDVKSYLEPIVLIRDFNRSKSKNKETNALERSFLLKNSSCSGSSMLRLENDLTEENPLEGTSTMFQDNGSVSDSSNSARKPGVHYSHHLIKGCDSDSDSDDCDETAVDTSRRKLESDSGSSAVKLESNHGAANISIVSEPDTDSSSKEIDSSQQSSSEALNETVSMLTDAGEKSDSQLEEQSQSQDADNISSQSMEVTGVAES